MLTKQRLRMEWRKKRKRKRQTLRYREISTVSRATCDSRKGKRRSATLSCLIKRSWIPSDCGTPLVLCLSIDAASIRDGSLPASGHSSLGAGNGFYSVEATGLCLCAHAVASAAGSQSCPCSAEVSIAAVTWKTVVHMFSSPVPIQIAPAACLEQAQAEPCLSMFAPR